MAYYVSLSRERERLGDFLGQERKRKNRPVLCGEGLEQVYAAFKSLFQGDHLGVEYALQSHSTLFQRAGPLQERSVILRNHLFLKGPSGKAL